MLNHRTNIYFHWLDFDKAIEEIASRLDQKKLLDTFDMIYGVPRNGLVLAVALSHAIEKPITLTLSPYYKVVSRTLIIDDISDSGKTLRSIGAAFKHQILTATIHVVEDSLVIPTIWLFEKKKGDWIVYPWEKYPKEET